ncbi:MAG: hypothetical protein K8F91_14210 [Candidatus Obscuribacterales bacterium]|nr:hypothetical protein [Candidatus Obscuribacterales bacterium]
MPNNEIEKTRKRLPIWACIAMVLLTTFLAFWFFGGEHYIQNYDDINYSNWRHEEDWDDLVRWIYFLSQIGVTAGFFAFIGSAALVTAINWPWARETWRVMS